MRGIARRNPVRHRFVRLPIALSVLLVLSGLLPVLAQVAAAQTDQAYVGYIPWVPREEMIGGQGPWYGLVSFQNLSDDFCFVQVFAGVEGEWAKPAQQLSVPERSLRNLSSQSLSLQKPGGPVRIEATCAIAVSLKEYTPNVPQNQSMWSTGAQVVTGYTGLGKPDLAAARSSATSDWYLPIVQTNSDWNTFIRIANFDEQPANVTVDIYPSENTDGDDGVARTVTGQVGVAGTLTIDVLDALGTTGFVGFARISADQDIGVVARRAKPGAGLAISNVAVAADSVVAGGTYQAGAPLIFTAYNGWNTGITMANVSQQTATVTVQYFPSDGAMASEETLFIAPRSMEYIYTPATVDQAGFVGSATIVSNVPIVAAVDEVKYETSEALSYIASGAGQQQAGIPLVFRENPAEGLHDNSGISIVNLDPLNQQNVTLRLRDRSGNELLDLPIALRIPAGSRTFIYLPFIDEIPAGTYGSVLLESQNPAGFVAISNDVNYAVGADGSVVFAASGNGGLYLVPAPEP
jgi:hypothetical protein